MGNLLAVSCSENLVILLKLGLDGSWTMVKEIEQEEVG